MRDRGSELTVNEIRAKSLVIGRQLERENWFNMSAADAEQWCKDKARTMNVSHSADLEAIALIAMNYVCNQTILTITGALERRTTK